jgi:hypothetical protein
MEENNGGPTETTEKRKAKNNVPKPVDLANEVEITRSAYNVPSSCICPIAHQVILMPGLILDRTEIL